MYAEEELPHSSDSEVEGLRKSKKKILQKEIVSEVLSPNKNEQLYNKYNLISLTNVYYEIIKFCKIHNL